MRQVGIFIYEGVQALDVIGPLEALFAASNYASEPAYNLQTISVDGKKVRSETGISLGADKAAKDISELHTLIIPGGATARNVPVNPEVVAAVNHLASRTRRLVSVCTGAFLVAEAGLAHGKRVATHWKFAHDLAARFPDIEVDGAHLYVCDDGFYSSAGILAGIDLTLALIESDVSEAVAMSVARELVIYLRRTGGQAQFLWQIEGKGIRRAYTKKGTP